MNEIDTIRQNHGRLFFSIKKHFAYIETGHYDWKLDPKYPNNSDGICAFYEDLIESQPNACAQYEIDKNLKWTKVDIKGDRIFSPETVRFQKSFSVDFQTLERFGRLLHEFSDFLAEVLSSQKTTVDDRNEPETMDKGTSTPCIEAGKPCAVHSKKIITTERLDLPEYIPQRKREYE